MANLIVDTFKEGHLDMIDARPEDYFIRSLIKNAAQHVEQSATIVLIDPDPMKVVFMGGIFQQWPGVGEAWLVSSDLIGKHVRKSLPLIENFIHICAMQMNMYRIQASVPVFQVKYQTFIEHFGFRKEGRMRKYGLRGEDHFRYARIR